MLATACLDERERPGPPTLSLTIDDPQVSASREDTVAGNVHVEDADGVDSVWVTLNGTQQRFDAGFDRVFDSPYRLVSTPGLTPGERVPLTFRARDIAGFGVQRDTYVVVVP